jgi:hypothetical protein
MSSEILWDRGLHDSAAAHDFANAAAFLMSKLLETILPVVTL